MCDITSDVSAAISASIVRLPNVSNACLESRYIIAQCSVLVINIEIIGRVAEQWWVLERGGGVTTIITSSNINCR